MLTRSWQDLSGRQQTVILILASVELALAATAWADLASRPAAEVNGRKRTWAALIGINFIGPLAYSGGVGSRRNLADPEAPEADRRGPEGTT